MEEFETSHEHVKSVCPYLKLFFFFTLKCRNAKTVGNAIMGNSSDSQKKRESP